MWLELGVVVVLTIWVINVLDSIRNDVLKELRAIRAAIADAQRLHPDRQ